MEGERGRSYFCRPWPLGGVVQGLENLKPGDEIISSVMEHHSNLVPWQVEYTIGCMSLEMPLLI